MGNNVGDWLEVSVRCIAAIRPESEVKPTYRHRSIDAIDPQDSWIKRSTSIPSYAVDA
jgi:hypothetical protein